MKYTQRVVTTFTKLLSSLMRDKERINNTGPAVSVNGEIMRSTMRTACKGIPVNMRNSEDMKACSIEDSCQDQLV